MAVPMVHIWPMGVRVDEPLVAMDVAVAQRRIETGMVVEMVAIIVPMHVHMLHRLMYVDVSVLAQHERRDRSHQQRAGSCLDDSEVLAEQHE